MIVLDTHVLLWWVSHDKALGGAARRRLDREAAKQSLVVSAISLWEIATLVRRGRLVLGQPVDRWMADLALEPLLKVQAVDTPIAVEAGALTDALHGDPGDRLVIATARVLGASLATEDARLRDSGLVPLAW